MNMHLGDDGLSNYDNSAAVVVENSLAVLALSRYLVG